MKWFKLKYDYYFSDDFEFFKTQVYSYYDKSVGKHYTRPTIFFHAFKHETDKEDLELTHKLLKEGFFGQVEIIEKDFEDFWETTQTKVKFKDPEVQEKVNHLDLTFIPKTGLGVGVEFWNPRDNYSFLAMTDKEYERYVEKCKAKGEKPQSNKWQKIREYTQDEFDVNFEFSPCYQVNYITKQGRVKNL